MNVEASAKFIGSSLAELHSNKIQSFVYGLESNAGSCYNTKTTTNSVSIPVSFNADVKVRIEQNGKTLSGDALINQAQSLLKVFNTNDQYSVSLNVDGHMTVNILGLGSDNIVDCN